ncbi:response regulator transcription factor [Bacillus kwashiorkori]|uniref:response regulator transcription factor n=1 Tax=Bacillus kwashiorkori TaxID=1522318 RepID=UPI000784F19C|nr:LuxR C-terminal-related transcriptional regulator [Bacillus kwashiorkori]
MGNKEEFEQLELLIIQLIAAEKTNKAIARELNYSQRMVEYYINKISKKLDAQTRAGIVYKACQLKLIK